MQQQSTPPPPISPTGGGADRDTYTVKKILTTTTLVHVAATGYELILCIHAWRVGDYADVVKCIASMGCTVATLWATLTD